MHMRIRRRGVLGIFGVAAAAVTALAATAYACTNLSTITLSNGSARPGDNITVTGTSFGGGGCGCRPRGVTPVQIRWNGRAGEVLTEANADTAGSISGSFTVPEAKPGLYTIAAVQRDLELDMDDYGTPALASLEVLGPNGESVVQPGVEGLGSPDAANSGPMIALTMALGMLSLGLLVAGSVAVGRGIARKGVPAAASVRKD
jgi:hypothetical protein